MAKRGRKRKNASEAPVNTRIVLNSKQIKKSDNRRSNRKRREKVNSNEISEEGFEDGGDDISVEEEDQEFEESYASEDLEDNEESSEEVIDKPMTERQKYLMRKKNDENFQDELNIPSLDQFRKVGL